MVSSHEHGRSVLSARPSDRFRLLQSWLLGDARDLGRLRHELLAVASRASPAPSDDVAGHVVLVASELATNALRHGSGPTGVHLSSDRGDLLLDVSDEDTVAAPSIATGRDPGEGGFGLVIAQQLSHELGWYTTATTKHVWATFTT